MVTGGQQIMSPDEFRSIYVKKTVHNRKSLPLRPFYHPVECSSLTTLLEEQQLVVFLAGRKEIIRLIFFSPLIAYVPKEVFMNFRKFPEKGFEMLKKSK